MMWGFSIDEEPEMVAGQSHAILYVHYHKCPTSCKVKGAFEDNAHYSRLCPTRRFNKRGGRENEGNGILVTTATGEADAETLGKTARTDLLAVQPMVMPLLAV